MTKLVKKKAKQVFPEDPTLEIDWYRHLYTNKPTYNTLTVEQDEKGHFFAKVSHISVHPAFRFLKLYVTKNRKPVAGYGLVFNQKALVIRENYRINDRYYDLYRRITDGYVVAVYTKGDHGGRRLVSYNNAIQIPFRISNREYYNTYNVPISKQIKQL